ncbi:MAG: hypothetical protein ABR928_19230 [Terracidiphilus sp.]|jgi:hypothetical protein
MRATLAASLFALICTPLSAQAQAPAASAPASHTYSSPLGFSYTIPGDWEVVDSQASLPDVKDKAAQSDTSEAEKKGVGCTQMGLTARHGGPISVIVQVALPFDCFGQRLTQADLPGFGAGAAEGLKQNFDISDPLVATYMLGSYPLWAERVHGTPKGQPDKHYTIEISCALLSKAAVCWLTMAADSNSLAIFENGAVTLDDDPPVALVPAGTFKQ